MGGFVAVWIPRLVGILGSLAAGKAAEVGLTLDPAELTTLAITTYALLHRAISKKLNPGDAAKQAVVEKEKSTVRVEEANAKNSKFGV